MKKIVLALVATAWCLLFASTGEAHHVMDYALPVTALDGLLSGLGHPVIGIDHLLFLAGAGVFAARFEKGWRLPLYFVATSTVATTLRYLGADTGLGELPVAGSLVLLGLLMLGATAPRRGVTTLLFVIAGAIHGYALAEAIVGAEPTPLLAYLAGLAAIECAIAAGAWAFTAWLAVRRPAMPWQKMSGAAVGLAGVVFAVTAL